MKDTKQDTPKNLMNAETMQMLASWWMDEKVKGYFMNARTQQVWALRKIKNKSFEADALELAERNGRISFVEELLQLMKIAYADSMKVKQNEIQQEKI